MAHYSLIFLSLLLTTNTFAASLTLIDIQPDVEKSNVVMPSGEVYSLTVVNPSVGRTYVLSAYSNQEALQSKRVKFELHIEPAYFASQLKLAFASNKKIGFHGASNGLNVFLYIANLNKGEFSIFDGDEAKAGQFLPSCRSPVKHVSDTDYASYDILVISALSFFDEIKSSAIDRGYRPEQIVPMSMVGVKLLAECREAE